MVWLKHGRKTLKGGGRGSICPLLNPMCPPWPPLEFGIQNAHTPTLHGTPLKFWTDRYAPSCKNFWMTLIRASPPPISVLRVVLRVRVFSIDTHACTRAHTHTHTHTHACTRMHTHTHTHTHACTHTRIHTHAHTHTHTHTHTQTGNHDVYRLQAGSEEERDQWIQSIKAAISQGSVYDAFQQRKRKIASVQGLELPGLEWTKHTLFIYTFCIMYSLLIHDCCCWSDSCFWVFYYDIFVCVLSFNYHKFLCAQYSYILFCKSVIDITNRCIISGERNS